MVKERLVTSDVPAEVRCRSQGARRTVTSPLDFFNEHGAAEEPEVLAGWKELEAGVFS